ncbi:uncharacterized protein LY89DRAFT_773942 [Mollisia scopiformis]|uniref:Uncharacterized protein n=1 Tax=Mollisia scopiformis TaxID=149040 RepID=A0A194XH86_MOLSC|nr:uncharacterized protein LY89DRAFT_773942 [Mollisia scopiformis]KUJ19489.1 hypothetical protein LY89DRAFT_773942 [Mollisia scopiformis]
MLNETPQREFEMETNMMLSLSNASSEIVGALIQKGGNDVYHEHCSSHPCLPLLFNWSSVCIDKVFNMRLFSFQKGKTLHGFDETTDDEQGQRPLWLPIYLHRYYLFCLAVIFMIMIVALEILHYLSTHNHGLATTTGNEHYLWTYGPTAVLTIFTAFWGQVEYWTKHVMPFQVLATSSSPAEDNILLDYLSPMTFIALYKAIRASHYPVAVSITGSLLLRALIIFSTGLLNLEQQIIMTQTQLTVLDRFNFTTNNSNTTSTVDLTSEIWAIKAYNLSFPFGTTDTYTSQSIKPLADNANTTWTTELDVFSAGLEQCEPFNWTYADPNHPYAGPIPGLANPPQYINVWSPSCYMHNVSLFYEPVWTPPVWNAQLQYQNCTNTTGKGDPGRLLMSLSFSLQYNDSGLYAPPTDYLRNLSGLLCRPTLSIAKRTVSGFVNSSIKISDSTMPGLSTTTNVPNYMVMPLLTQLVQMRADDTDITTYYDGGISAWFALLNETVPQKDVTAWANSQLLGSVSQLVFPTVAAQVAKQYFMDAVSEVQPGALGHIQNRLCIEPLSLRLMEAGLALVAITSILLALYPFKRLPRPFGSIGALALIIARSPILQQLLRGTGALSLASLKTKLQRSSFTTSPVRTTSTFCIDVQREVDTQDSIGFFGPDARGLEDRWHPVPVIFLFRSGTVVGPLLLIAILEALYRYSESNSGLIDAPANEYAKYAWLYLPALVMYALGTLYLVLDSFSKTIHPYQKLARGSANRQALMEDHFGKIELYALGEAISCRHIALVATTLIVLLAPLLTIVVSGLYIPQPFPATQPVLIHQVDWFNIQNDSWTNSSYVFGASQNMIGLIQYCNVSFPSGTFDELAFPTVQLDKVPLSKDSNASQVAIGVQAARGRMNCSLVEYVTNSNLTAYPQYQKFLEQDNRTVTVVTWEMIIPVNETAGCTSRSPNISLTSSGLLQIGTLAVPDSGYFGMEVYPRLKPGLSGNTYCESRYESWHIIGHQARPALTDELSLMRCMPFIETVFVNATLSLPTLDIVATPQVDEATATPLLDQGSPVAVGIPNIGIWGTISYTDDFFLALTTGIDAVPIDELSEPTNTQELLQNMDHLYAQAAAQVLNFNYRTSAAPSPGTPWYDDIASPRNGTLTQQDRVRLVQSMISTRILEAILAVIAFCAAIAWLLTRDAKKLLLPKNPASIAAKVSLLVDSELLETIPEGAEWDNDDELRRKGVFEGYVYSLGWWRGRDGERRFGIDIGVPDGDEVEGVEIDSKTEKEKKMSNGSSNGEIFRLVLDLEDVNASSVSPPLVLSLQLQTPLRDGVSVILALNIVLPAVIFIVVLIC